MPLNGPRRQHATWLHSKVWVVHTFQFRLAQYDDLILALFAIKGTDLKFLVRFLANPAFPCDERGGAVKSRQPVYF